MIRAECEALKAVAVWDNYGTFSREDISTMISGHNIKRIRGMVKEEEKWFLELENLLLDHNSVDKIEEVRIFRDLIWSNDEKDVVLNYGEVSGFMIFALSFAIDGSPMIYLISSSNL